MLVIVEDGNVQEFAQACLDLEAAWCRDVFEVDPPVHGGNALYDSYDFVDVLGRQTHRPCVDTRETFEEQGLALHDRQRRFRSDVAQSEYRRPVSDDRHGVALDCEVTCGGGILRNGHGDSCNAWRIGHR